jgi:hypothetical protein
MTDSIPIRQLVLYKHGVGRVTRRGQARGQQVTLTFALDEIDDALKSLTVWTHDGGKVSEVRYRTPLGNAEGRAVLAPGAADESALFALLRGLRGIPVGVKLEGARTVEGRVIGLEQHPQGRKFGAMLVLLTDAGLVEQIATDRITQVRVGDDRAARDLARSLDVPSTRAEARGIAVDLTEPDREVELSYTVPAPVWRVSYRLVADTSDDSCLLQGWAIFDNRFEEDLEDVELSLVAGQPVSFRYDLTSSVIPQRRLVRDEARAAAGTLEFEPMYDVPAFAAASPAPPDAGTRGVAMRSVAAGARQPHWSALDLVESTQLQAQGEDLAEIFEYHVGLVSVRVGESAMVPVAQHTGKYSRELLYNGRKHPRHPVVSLRLRNDSGLTLERGPATIMEDGQYRGEAILPYTREGAELVLAYAVELGVSVVEDTRIWTETAGITLPDAFLHLQEHHVQETTYSLTNSTPDEQTVTIERSKWGDLAGTPKPDEESAENRRWRAVCPARAVTTFEVRERVLTERRETVADESMEALAHFLEERALDTEAREKLSGILRLRQTISRIDDRLQSLDIEQAGLAARQERLRANLTIEATSEDERAIRRRSAEDFRRTQDREEEIVAERQRLREERHAAEAALENELARL